MKKSYIVCQYIIMFILIFISFKINAAIPGQFIAKLYTESLGRAPDPSGWQYAITQFSIYGCSENNLKSFGMQLYSSSEYSGLSYGPIEKVITAYRGILNREPDSNGGSYYVNLLNSGYSFSVIVNDMFNSSEFKNKVPTICAGGSYGWGATPVLQQVPSSGSGFSGGSGYNLQTLLNNAAPGTTVYLAQRAVVIVDSQLVIPAGVTLATTGLPSRNNYARMGRIVRNSIFDAPLIKMEPGAKLLSVWVSGQHPIFGFKTNASNVYVRGGTGSAVNNSRLDTSSGWTAVFAHGYLLEKISCNNLIIDGNLITNYSSQHIPTPTGRFSDGISNACENATITNNHIIDPTDVGIVLYRAQPAQSSKVNNNIIVSAGLSAYAAISADPLNNDTNIWSFSNMQITSNQFWTSPTTHYDIGLAVGTLAWFDNSGSIGSGGTFTNNTNGNIVTNMDSAITVDGLINSVVQSNTFTQNNYNISPCPSGGVIADVQGNHASLPLQPWTQGVAHNCITQSHLF